MHRASLLISIASGAIVALVASPCLYFVAGRMAQCRPGEGDGQCALGTFMLQWFAVAVGIALWPIASVFTWKYILPRTQKTAEHRQ
jgi:hypothetical protein